MHIPIVPEMHKLPIEPTIDYMFFNSKIMSLLIPYSHHLIGAIDEPELKQTKLQCPLHNNQHRHHNLLPRRNLKPLMNILEHEIDLIRHTITKEYPMQKTNVK